jgi:DNA modification methylase
MLIRADSTGVLPLADGSVQCVVTSPPYWGLRDYGVAGQMGLEATVGEYVEKMVGVFREVRRVLKDDGVVWLNLGDAYCNFDKWGGGGGNTGKHTRADDGTVPSWAVRRKREISCVKDPKSKQASRLGCNTDGPNRDPNALVGLKPKDLIGMPWRVAFALQAAGWWLRCDVVWHKPNPMPESVTDRPTRAHEFIFLLSKSARYFYDADAIREPMSESTFARLTQPNVMTQPDGPKDSGEGNRSHSKVRKNLAAKIDKQRGHGRRHAGFNERWDNREAAGDLGKRAFQAELTAAQGGRNKRSVWTVATAPCAEAHFATFPEGLVEPCILAGSRPGDVVLDPFSGTGTVERVAVRHGRKGVGLELNGKYIGIAKKLQGETRKSQLLFSHG